MPITLPEKFQKEFLQIIERGTETEAREFLIANMKEFPSETQDAIIVSLLEEALEKKVEGDVIVSDFRKDVIKTMHTLGNNDRELEKQAKLAEIREEIV